MARPNEYKILDYYLDDDKAAAKIVEAAQAERGCVSRKGARLSIWFGDDRDLDRFLSSKAAKDAKLEKPTAVRPELLSRHTA